MACKNCSIISPRITFQLNKNLLSLISNHFIHYGHHFNVQDIYLETNEKGAIDLYDFLIEMELANGVKFKLNKLDWHSLESFHDFVEASWIDSILNEDHLTMHFQPIVEADGKIFGYELLARFNDDNGNIIYPDKIFPAAKIRGRTFALDRICRMHAVKQIERLKSNQKGFINFIPTAIYSPEHCLRTTTLIANRLNIDPKRIIFEVVETEKIDDMDHLKNILHYYQKNGFQYALDDVGAGYNTLNVLEELSPPYMKLDMKFVLGVADDSEKQAVALSFLEKARYLNSIPLAEGIETVEDFNWLKKQGYQLFQGYYFGKPQSEPLETEYI